MANEKHRRELARWNSALQSGDPMRIATTARALTEAKSKVDTDFRFTLCDSMWVPTGSLNRDLMEASGTDPRNDVPVAAIKYKGSSPLVELIMDCRKTMVGIEVETAAQRYNFYVKTHRYRYEDSALTGNIEARGIYDILNYYVIWPSWFLPIQFQPISHAVYIWALCTVLENMVAECALRLQSGWLEFINNALSLNPDIRAWFGTILQALNRDGLSIQTFTRMLRTPMYVKRHNPFLDTSPLVGRTVRMETVGAVARDITRAYGVDTNVQLWRPGDPQPDNWTKNFFPLDQPTYVFSTKDRSQITGPTHTVLDSVIRQVVDLGGALGGIFNVLVDQVPGMDGAFYSPFLGQDYETPYAIVELPDQVMDRDGNVTAGESSVIWAEVADHTPEGWQHIIGGRSPKWVGAPWSDLGGTGLRANSESTTYSTRPSPGSSTRSRSCWASAGFPRTCCRDSSTTHSSRSSSCSTTTAATRSARTTRRSSGSTRRRARRTTLRPSSRSSTPCSIPRVTPARS